MGMAGDVKGIGAIITQTIIVLKHHDKEFAETWWCRHAVATKKGPILRSALEGIPEPVRCRKDPRRQAFGAGMGTRAKPARGTGFALVALPAVGPAKRTT